MQGESACIWIDKARLHTLVRRQVISSHVFDVFDSASAKTNSILIKNEIRYPGKTFFVETQKPPVCRFSVMERNFCLCRNTWKLYEYIRGVSSRAHPYRYIGTNELYSFSTGNERF